MRCRKLIAIPVLLTAYLAFSASASADLQVCEPGAKAGQCTSPRGLAVDFETGDVFVADNGNDRIDKFEENGKTIGTPPSWPVADPAWIAVDNDPASPSHHDVYLSTGEFTVKKFKPNGELLATFGEKGDGTPEGCQLERADDQIAVGPNGDVFLADSYDKDGGGIGDTWVNRVVKFDDAGNCIGTVSLFEGPNQKINDLAVDSAGAIYVTVEGDSSAIRKYDSSGALLKEFEKLNTSGLAVDDSDHLFAAQQAGSVLAGEQIRFYTEYDSSGAIQRRFDYASGSIFSGDFPTVAANSSLDGDVYISNRTSGVRYFPFPPPRPIVFSRPCQVKAGALGNVKATLVSEVNPEGKATTVHYEYITDADFKANGNSFAGIKPASTTPGSTLPPLKIQGVVEAEIEATEKEIEDTTGEGKEKAEEKLKEQEEDLERIEKEAPFVLHEAAVLATSLEAETTYHCRVVATNADGSITGEEGTFKTKPGFEFGSSWVADVKAEEATVNVEGNPLGIPATGQVEYVEDSKYQATGFAEAQSAPADELDFGAGEEMQLRSVVLKGLVPGALYHYRLRARNGNPAEGIVCPELKPSCPELERTFRTYKAEAEKVDGRAWEMVSPEEKNSAEVVGPPNGRGFIESRSIQIQAGATSGEALTYTSWTSFGHAEGAPATSQYLSKRTPGGWQTENISPFGFQVNLFVPPYLGFTPDLGFGAVTAGENSLAPGCPVERENLYLREANGQLRCLTPEEPAGIPNKFGYCFNYAGASEDGSRVFFKASVPYAGAPAGTGNSLYEWHEGKLSVVSVLPGQEAPAPPGSRTSFGMKSLEGCQTGQTLMRHAISADGSKAIWTYWPGTPSTTSRLMMRVDGFETVPLDVKQPSGSGGGNGIFWAASEDGSVVYFTAPSALVKGSKAEAGAEDLYRYRLGEEEPLTDITSGPVPGGVAGVLGASDDGSVVYFAAKAALTPEAEVNEAGQHSEAGKINLYVFDGEEETTRFIAILSIEDGFDWETQPKGLTARVTPDGKHLAFLSVKAKELADYDNRLAATSGRFGGGKECQLGESGAVIGGPLCPQAFVYDAQAKSLTCASCNPSGARPLGPARFPGWTNIYEGPRYLSDNGARLFFESFDKLLPGDENLKRDIYEFELPGEGSCSTQNPNFDTRAGGCLFLLSGGKSSDESYLIDASADGRDVFFSTRSQLSGWDGNGNYDAYDYREGGGFPEPVQAEPCMGEACKPPSGTPPANTSPVTPHFIGAGKPAAEKPKKRKHRKKKSHKRKSHKREGKANRNGRATR